jgi:hypothetical protein
MLELEKLGLVELNAQEVQEIEGGMWPPIGWWMDCGFSVGIGYSWGSPPRYV